MKSKKRNLPLENSVLLFAALGDENRMRVVSRLCDEGPLSIAELTKDSRITRQAITRHLQVLQEADLVHGSRQGREQIWELEKKRLQIAQDYLAQISNHWDKALGRLKSLVEDEKS